MMDLGGVFLVSFRSIGSGILSALKRVGWDVSGDDFDVVGHLGFYHGTSISVFGGSCINCTDCWFHRWQARHSQGKEKLHKALWVVLRFWISTV